MAALIPAEKLWPLSVFADHLRFVTKERHLFPDSIIVHVHVDTTGKDRTFVVRDFKNDVYGKRQRLTLDFFLFTKIEKCLLLFIANTNISLYCTNS